MTAPPGALYKFISRQLNPDDPGVILPHLSQGDKQALSQCGKDVRNYLYLLSKLRITAREHEDHGVFETKALLLLMSGLNKVDYLRVPPPRISQCLELLSFGCCAGLKSLDLSVVPGLWPNGRERVPRLEDSGFADDQVLHLTLSFKKGVLSQLEELRMRGYQLTPDGLGQIMACIAPNQVATNKALTVSPPSCLGPFGHPKMLGQAREIHSGCLPVRQPT